MINQAERVIWIQLQFCVFRLKLGLKVKNFHEKVCKLKGNFEERLQSSAICTLLPQLKQPTFGSPTKNYMCY